MYTATVLLLTYNQESYIKEAIIGVLSQNYNNLKIVISDDNSTDNTFKIICETVNNFNSFHEVIINKNNKNLGLVRHINKLVNDFCEGDFVFLAAGDDISLNNRVSESVTCFQNNEDCYAVVSKLSVIDSNGNIVKMNPNQVFCKKLDLNYSLKELTFINGGVALGFRKNLFEIFGNLSDSCPTEDSTIRLRALLAGKIYYIDKVLSLYRIHDNNMSRIENLFNLKVNCIANQLNKDRILAYKLDLIGSRLNFLLKLKILFYEKFQFYNTSILKNKFINKYLSKFILLLYKSLTFSFINYEK